MRTKSFPGVWPPWSQERRSARGREEGVERGAGKAACQGGGASVIVGGGGVSDVLIWERKLNNMLE